MVLPKNVWPMKAHGLSDCQYKTEANKAESCCECVDKVPDVHDILYADMSRCYTTSHHEMLKQHGMHAYRV